jgi:hypothetical protein
MEQAKADWKTDQDNRAKAYKAWEQSPEYKIWEESYKRKGFITEIISDYEKPKIDVTKKATGWKEPHTMAPRPPHPQYNSYIEAYYEGQRAKGSPVPAMVDRLHATVKYVYDTTPEQLDVLYKIYRHNPLSNKDRSILQQIKHSLPPDQYDLLINSSRAEIE